MKKSEKLELILSVITEEWCTYSQIHSRIKKVISVGEISILLVNYIQSESCIIEHEYDQFGKRHYQGRMKFRKLRVTI